MKSSYVLVAFALWFCPTEQAPSCHTSQYDACLLPSLMNARRSALPNNSSALTSSCKIWSNSWKCVDSYVSNCLSDIQRMMVDVMWKQPRKIFKGVCDPSSKLRADLEKVLPCASEAVTLTIQTCTDNLENVIHMISGDDADDRVNAACCYFERFYQCLQRNTDKLCGKGSFNTLDKVLEFFHFNTANSVCYSHDPDSEICSDYLNRTVPAPSEDASYIARFASTFLRFSKG